MNFLRTLSFFCILAMVSGKEAMTEEKCVKLEEELVVLQEKFEQTEMRRDHELLELNAKLEDLRKRPMYHMCVYQDQHSMNGIVISFDKTLYRSSFQCDDAHIDLNTGVFITGASGTYMVTWDLWGNNYQNIDVYLRKNGVKIDETRHHSYTSDADGFNQSDQGKP